MTESATLRVDVVEKGARQVSVNLDAVSRSAASAEKSTDKFKKELSSTEIEARKTGSALGALKNIAASYLTFKTLQGAVKMADTMTVLRSQVNLVTKSQEESIAVQQQLFDISNRTYASLEATTTLYTRTARALQHLNKTNAETLKFTEAVNNAMRLGGVSATEQASALLQLSQALGSGVLQGDEFRSIAESAPILLDILSQHLGVMRGELKQMGSEGKITSEIIFEALSGAGDKLARQATDMPVTFGQSMQVMNTHVMSFVDSMMNGSGIMTAVAATVVTLAENIEYILVPAMGIGGVFAVKALTTAFMMLGGPMGIIAVVIGALGLLAVAWDQNSKKIDTFRSKVNASLSDLSSKTKSQLDALALDLEITISHDAKAYHDAKNDLAEMEKQLATLKKRFEILTPRQRGFTSIGREIELLTEKIIKQKGELDGLRDVYNKNLDNQKLLTIFRSSDNTEGGAVAIQESKEYLEIMKKIHNQADLIGKSGAEAKYIQLEQNGELEKMTGIQRTIIKLFLEMNDAAAQVANNQQSLNSMIEAFGREAATAGMNRRQVALFDAESLGATPEELGKINAYFDKISKSGGKGFGGSNPFTDRLKALTEEASKLQAINAEIQKYGEVGRYTAVQEITAELNNQNGVLSGISGTQKQMLLDQAMLLDNQRQMNEVLMLGSDYTQQLSDMSFELELIGKTADEIEDLRFIRELEIRTRAIANGASQETITLLNQEIAKIKELKAENDNKKFGIENDAFGGMEDGFVNYMNSMGTVRDQFTSVTSEAFGSLTGAIANFAVDAKSSFSDMTASILKNIARMLIEMAILNAVKMAFGGFANGGTPNAPSAGDIGGGIPYPHANGGIVGFADGGFTGFGSKYEPAGIVHRGEVVFSQADVARHGGLERVEKMRKGYSLGGVVGFGNTLPQVANDQKSNRNDGITINITQYEDGSQEVDVTKDGRALENLVKVNVRKEIANQLRSGGQLARR